MTEVSSPVFDLDIRVGQRAYRHLLSERERIDRSFPARILDWFSSLQVISLGTSMFLGLALALVVTGNLSLARFGIQAVPVWVVVLWVVSTVFTVSYFTILAAYNTSNKKFFAREGNIYDAVNKLAHDRASDLADWFSREHGLAHPVYSSFEAVLLLLLKNNVSSSSLIKFVKDDGEEVFGKLIQNASGSGWIWVPVRQF